MALVKMNPGDAITAASVGQIIDLLNGVMTDQLVTLKHTGGASLALDRNDAAAILAAMELRRQGVTKGWLGVDASDNLAFLNIAATAANLWWTDAGAVNARGSSTAPILGVTGAPSLSNAASARNVGFWTTVGGPAGLTSSVNDYGRDANGNLWMCTVAGTPGTWVPVGVHVVYEFDNTVTAVASQRIPASGNFPSGYKHMRIYFRVRDTSAGTSADGVDMQVNGDAAAHYDWMQATAADNNVFSATGSFSQTAGRIGSVVQGGLADTNLFSANVLTLMDFASTNWDKSGIWEANQQIGIAAGNSNRFTGTWHWHGTAAAIQNLLLKVHTASVNFKGYITVEMWA
jgi:hypothetical protein